MHPITKMSLANEIFEICIKLNLETKRGNDTNEVINNLREKLDTLANFANPLLRHDIGAVGVDNLLPVGPRDLLEKGR